MLIDEKERSYGPLFLQNSTGTPDYGIHQSEQVPGPTFWAPRSQPRGATAS